MATEPPDQPRSDPSNAGDNGGGGGGKIVTNKRRWRFSPYDRPPPPPAAESSSWLSGVVVPASRKIASGAAKILSSVFIPDSSSSDSSHEEDYISDDDVSCDNDRDGLPNGTNESNLEAERKDAIKQLLLQETFSREECDMFVKIIHSRVDSGFMPGRRVSNVTPDHAVMEARKFLEEKKAGRSPQSDFGHGSIGSPADMAKSYMLARPPWVSPSTGNFDLRTVRKDSITHLKERNYPQCGAWNMQDEIRRLRSKAAEDMVSPLSSSKVDLSLLSPLPRSSQNNGVTVAIPGDNAAAGSNKDIPASDIREGVVIEASLDPDRKQDSKASQNDSVRAMSDRSLIPDHAGTNISSRNDTVNVESLSQNSLDELSQGQSQEQSETEGKKSKKKLEKKPVRRQPKRQTKG